MKRKMSVATLVALGAFVLVALSAVLLLLSSGNAAHAQSSPSVAISLSDTSVVQGAAITVYRSWFLGHFARGNHAAAPVLGESAWRTAAGSWCGPRSGPCR